MSATIYVVEAQMVTNEWKPVEVCTTLTAAQALIDARSTGRYQIIYRIAEYEPRVSRDRRTVFRKTYSSESAVNACRDVSEVLDDDYVMRDVPKDEHGFRSGAFTITIEWEPDR